MQERRAGQRPAGGCGAPSSGAASTAAFCVGAGGPLDDLGRVARAPRATGTPAAACRRAIRGRHAPAGRPAHRARPRARSGRAARSTSSTRTSAPSMRRTAPAPRNPGGGQPARASSCWARCSSPNRSRRPGAPRAGQKPPTPRSASARKEMLPADERPSRGVDQQQVAPASSGPRRRRPRAGSSASPSQAGPVPDEPGAQRTGRASELVRAGPRPHGAQRLQPARRDLDVVVDEREDRGFAARQRLVARGRRALPARRGRDAAARAPRGRERRQRRVELRRARPGAHPHLDVRPDGRHDARTARAVITSSYSSSSGSSAAGSRSSTARP